jgi:HK97 gp10 family phage protein
VIDLKLEGLEAVQEQLKELEAVAAARALARAARKAFAPVLEEARARAPVDTRLLRDHISIATVRPKGGAAVVRVGLKVRAVRGAQKLGRKTASPHWRWHFVEVGTVKMAAKPFMRPALDGNAQRVVDLLKAELVTSIGRALKRQRRAGR